MEGNMFYKLNQNNSGGYFVVNEKVCHRLFIEANNEEEALQIAESLGYYWDGVNKGLDCSCCGDRWSPYCDKIDISKLQIETNSFTSIEEYAQFLANGYGVKTTPNIRIFYKNGNIKEIFAKGQTDS